MNIGMIKNILETVPNPNNVDVYFDFCACVPDRVASWRGVYAEPAIGWAGTSYSGNGKAPNVTEFLAELEEATSGKVFQGWKGGEYTYNDSHELHVDNPGCSTHTIIAHIEIKEHFVILHTLSKE